MAIFCVVVLGDPWILVLEEVAVDIKEEVVEVVSLLVGKCVLH